MVRVRGPGTRQPRGAFRRSVSAALVPVLVVFLVVASTSLGVGAATDVAGGPDTPVAQQSTPAGETTPADPATEPTDDDPSNDSGTSNDSSDTTTPPPHRNPAEAGEVGDDERLLSYLEAELRGRLGGSVVHLSNGEYEAARSLLGDGYDDTLEKFVRVSADVDGDGDRTDRFERTGHEQRRFVDSVATYREVQTEYREAKADGNETQARELARELDGIAADVSTSGSRLRLNYQSIATATGNTTVDVSAELATIDTVEAEIRSQQELIAQAEFTPTTLVLTETAPRGSFLQPVAIAGRLYVGSLGNGTVATPTTAAAGVDSGSLTPLADETVPLAVNGAPLVAETDATGAFSLAYRPTTERLGTGPLHVQYRPAADSIYLGSAANATAHIDQVTPTVTLVDGADAGTFGMPVTATGRVHVDGIPAADVPVTVRVGESLLGVVRTDANGTYAYDQALPANVSVGDHPLSAGFDPEGRALAPASATAASPFAVTATGTTVTVEASSLAPEVIEVSGRLTTVDGRPVAGRPVVIATRDNVAGVVRTDPDGSYRTVVWVAASGTDQEPVRVTATYDVPTGNLAPSTAETVVLVRFFGTAPSDDAAGQTTPVERIAALGTSIVEEIAALTGLPVETVRDTLAPALGGLGFLALVVLLVRRVLARRRAGTGPLGVGVVPNLANDGGVAAAATGGRDGLALATLVERARALIGIDAVGAVKHAYAAARSRLASDLGVADRGTPREFLAACRSTASEASLDEFAYLTAAYERAVFSPREPTPSLAANVVSAVERLLSLTRR